MHNGIYNLHLNFLSLPHRECTVPNMPDRYDLGQIQVTCEGYDYPDDPYILRGSCGVEYELVIRDASKPAGMFKDTQQKYVTIGNRRQFRWKQKNV